MECVGGPLCGRLQETKIGTHHTVTRTALLEDGFGPDLMPPWEVLGHYEARMWPLVGLIRLLWIEAPRVANK